MSLNSDSEAHITARVVGVVCRQMHLPEHAAVPIAKGLVASFSAEFGGERLYISNARKPSNIQRRNQAVLADLKRQMDGEFDRDKRKALCRRHGISERTLYRILSSRRRIE